MNTVAENLKTEGIIIETKNEVQFIRDVAGLEIEKKELAVKAINNLNLLLRLIMGFLSILTEQIDRKLLTIKIIERSKSLRGKVILYLSQIARGIGKILSYARCGIKEFQNIEVREKYKQLKLRL